MERKHWELRKLKEAIEREMAWKPMRALALGKVKKYIQGLEKPKAETLDRLALFVGFQDWESFREALQGDADAAANYDVDQPKKGEPTAKKGDEKGERAEPIEKGEDAAKEGDVQANE